MGLFRRKVVKELMGSGAWGHLVSDHKIDVDTIFRTLRCVERKGTIGSTQTPVTFMRVFRPSEAEQKGVVVTGWETFDEHPDLVVFEGYLTGDNEAHLERKKT